MNTLWSILEHLQGLVLLAVMAGIVGCTLYLISHRGQDDRLLNDATGTYPTDTWMED